jgi:hypothetical protein
MARVGRVTVSLRKSTQRAGAESSEAGEAEEVMAVTRQSL